MEWQDMKTAPKGATEKNPTGEHWILGIDKFKNQKVIRWCMEYPSDGCWMYAYAPTDYIDGIQEFNPVRWMPLPEPYKD